MLGLPTDLAQASAVLPGLLARPGAHGEVPAPLTTHTALTSWQFEPWVTLGLSLTAAVYLAGVIVISRGRRRAWPWLRTASFLTGLLVIAVAVQSSIGTYDDVLFWIHMIQHLLLITVAPALLVWGRPITLLVRAVRAPTRRRVVAVLQSGPVAVLTHPIVGFSLYTACIVGTHLTGFMNLVLTDPFVHDAEHVLYLFAGYVYLLPLIGREPIRWRLPGFLRVLLLVLAMPVDTFTGIVLMQTTHEMFPAYAEVPRTWGPSPVTDLNWGGAVMWLGGDGLMGLLALIAFAAWMFSASASSQGLGGWLESIRRDRFTAMAGAGSEDTPSSRNSTVDDDETAMAAYNEYLARLNRPQGQRRQAQPPEGSDER